MRLRLVAAAAFVVCLLFATMALGQVAPGFYHVAEGSTVFASGGGFGIPYTATLRGEISISLNQSDGSAQILYESLEETHDGLPYRSLNTFCSPPLIDLVGTIQNPDTVIFVQPPADPTGIVELILTSASEGRLQLDGSIGSNCPDDFAYVFDAVELLPGRQQQPGIPGLGLEGAVLLAVTICAIGVIRLRSSGTV